MEKKNSFVLYTDYRRQFDLLTDAELGQLIRAVMDYVETGQPPDLPAGPQMAFAFISAQIDRDMKKKDLEKAAGISNYVISKMTRNENITVETVGKICKALNWRTLPGEGAEEGVAFDLSLIHI